MPSLIATVDRADIEVVPLLGVPGPISEGVTGSDGGGGRLMKWDDMTMATGGEIECRYREEDPRSCRQGFSLLPRQSPCARRAGTRDSRRFVDEVAGKPGLPWACVVARKTEQKKRRVGEVVGRVFVRHAAAGKDSERRANPTQLASKLAWHLALTEFS